MAQINTVQKLKYTFAPTTEGTSQHPEGQPAKVQGVPTWELTGNNTSGATIEPAADGMSAYVISGETANPDTLTVTATGDADMGEGVRPISASDSLTIIDAEAATAGLISGLPEPK